MWRVVVEMKHRIQHRRLHSSLAGVSRVLHSTRVAGVRSSRFRGSLGGRVLAPACYMCSEAYLGSKRELQSREGSQRAEMQPCTWMHDIACTGTDRVRAASYRHEEEAGHAVPRLYSLFFMARRFE